MRYLASKSSPKRRSWWGLTAFLSLLLALMLSLTSLPGQWDVAYASHCGTGTGTGSGAGSGTVGTGTTSVSFTVTVTASPTSVPANGATTSTITATVLQSGTTPIPNATLIFRATLGTLTVGTTSGTATTSTPIEISTTTNSSGMATATLKSVTTGTATIDAIVKDSANVARACPQTSVTFTTPPSDGDGDGDGGGAPPPTAPPTGEGPIGPGGGQVNAGEGATVDGGVTVNIQPGTFGTTTVNVQVTITVTAPPGVTPPRGSILLSKTIDITAGGPNTTSSLAQAARLAAALEKPVEVVVNLTTADLAGNSIDIVKVGRVEGATIVQLPTRVTNATEGIIAFTTDHLTQFTFFAVTNPGPSLLAPADAVTLSTPGAVLQWSNPPGTTWFQIQAIPFANDGPGIDLIIGDTAMVQAAQYDLKLPSFGSTDANYVLLPDITYVWRVRTAKTQTAPTENDWSVWSLRTLRTPKTAISTVSLASPEVGAVVSSRTPTLTWANTDKTVFYYEVEVSKDRNFGPNAFLYAEFIHGGVASPANSYTIPSRYTLEAGSTYYWRVRPRIQGDGNPVDWTTARSFATP